MVKGLRRIGGEGATRQIKYLQLNQEQPKHRCSPESRRRTVTGLHKEVRGKRVGMVPTRTTCQGYGTQMLLMHSKKHTRVPPTDYASDLTGKTETNGGPSDGQKNDS